MPITAITIVSPAHAAIIPAMGTLVPLWKYVRSADAIAPDIICMLAKDAAALPTFREYGSSARAPAFGLTSA